MDLYYALGLIEEYFNRPDLHNKPLNNRLNHIWCVSITLSPSFTKINL